MKFRICTAAALCILALSGCATMADWVGIATKEKVEQGFSATNEEIARIKKDVDLSKAAADELKQLAETMRKAVKTTDELQQLAKVLETRLDDLPRETIEQLNAILSEYLAKKKK
jgi:hypothetical protein